ncbi:hypothetical protein V8E55_011659 [Tylopilus felleus]
MEIENVPQTLAIPQLAEAHHHVAAAQITPSCLPTATCQWIGEGDLETCSAQITCESVPTHFRNSHSIRGLNADILICCRWKGCRIQLKRKFFTRHVRECHLGHLRGTKHPFLKLRCSH